MMESVAVNDERDLKRFRIRSRIKTRKFGKQNYKVVAQPI